jgi:hypothetical protein
MLAYEKTLDTPYCNWLLDIRTLGTPLAVDKRPECFVSSKQLQ